jgi:pimeloyl-ACP methyl ester carboxylesterase
MLTRFIAASLFCLTLSSCGGREAVPVEGAISIGTHALQIRVRGGGSPTVVIDAGLAGRSEEWHALQDALASEVLVVVYDRAGYGASEAGPLPRDSGREMDELKLLLDAAAIPGPYLLLGHSLGGLNAQVFAARYPEEVAGLVLLDPPPLAWIQGEGYVDLAGMARRMTDEWQNMADRGEASSEPGERAEAAFFRMIASEHREMFGESAGLAAAVETFWKTPVTVIASGVPNPAFGDVAEEFQAFWADESRKIAARSDRGEFVFAAKSTHRLHEDASDLVLASVMSMIERLPDPME